MLYKTLVWILKELGVPYGVREIIASYGCARGNDVLIDLLHENGGELIVHEHDRNSSSRRLYLKQIIDHPGYIRVSDGSIWSLRWETPDEVMKKINREYWFRETLWGGDSSIALWMKLGKLLKSCEPR